MTFWVVIKNTYDNCRDAKHCSGTSSHSKLQQVFSWQNFKIFGIQVGYEFRLIPMQWLMQKQGKTNTLPQALICFKLLFSV